MTTITITTTNSHFNVFSSYDRNLVAVMRSIPGRKWDKAAKANLFPATPASARNLVETLGDFGRLDVDEAFMGYVERAVAIEDSQDTKTKDDLPDVPESKTSAWLHQRQAFWFAKDLEAAGLFMDMGTGKSKVAVDLLTINGARHVLVLAPKSVVGVWPNQFKTHAGADWTVLALTNRAGSVAKRIEKADHALSLADATGKRLAIVINYEAARTDNFAKWALAHTWDYVILDESHRAKNPTGKTGKFIAKLAAKADRRLLLTGTPMPHSPLDIFAQYRFLDPAIFGRYKTAFMRKYAVMGGYENHEVLGWRNEDEMIARIHRLSYTCTADVLDLPEAVHIEIPVELEPKARKIYDKIENAFYAEVEGGTVNASNVLTKLLRLGQVTGGHVTDDDGTSRRISTAKAEALEDILDGTDRPVVVFTRFIADLDDVAEVTDRLGRRYGELSGRRHDLTENSTYPDVDVLGVQLQAGGVGIDLTHSHIVVYYGLSYSLGDYSQSLARVHRPGQDETVTYYHLVATDTEDATIRRALVERRELVDFFMDPNERRKK